jgi:hypothetical protein
MNFKNKRQEKPRSKRIPKSEVLTSTQKSLVIATLITDGWIELQSGGKNPRVGLQLCEASQPLLLKWKEELGVFCPGEPGSVLKTPPNSTESFLQFQLRTGSHPEFKEIYNAFVIEKQKHMPKCSFLMQHLTYESLAWMLMFDGSIKSAESKGLEIHTQGFPNNYAATSRLCVALYEKLGIMAKPTYFGTTKAGEEMYHVYISGHSLPLIRDKVLPHMFSEFKYKIPQLGERGEINVGQRTWDEWYAHYKEGIYREDLSISLVEDAKFRKQIA